MKTNVKTKPEVFHTHEGAVAARIGPEQELRRTVAACLLFESNFYESGVSIADRIKALVPQCRADFVAACAFEARTKHNLRHVPLLLVREMARHPSHRLLVGKLLPDVIQRADEIGEFVSLYWAEGKTPISKQIKVGLAKAFEKFNEYALAKYDRDSAQIKLRDIVFLTHAKAKDADHGKLLARLVNKDHFPAKTKASAFAVREAYGFTDADKPGLDIPDTWETQLSAGGDKKETFERLMVEGKLGALAFLRNLRNMEQVGISMELIRGYASALDVSRVLPFRYIAAARAVPQMEQMLEPLMLASCAGREKLPGKTVVLVDVSGSMDAKISDKSDLMRLDAACGVAIMLRELCEEVEILTFSNGIVRVPPRRGFGLRDDIVASQPHSGTELGKAVKAVNEQTKHDRLVVFSDEQSHDDVPAPKAKLAYMVNVAAHQHGVGYGKGWTHIDGFSEAVIDYIIESESWSRHERHRS